MGYQLPFVNHQHSGSDPDLLKATEENEGGGKSPSLVEPEPFHDVELCSFLSSLLSQRTKLEATVDLEGATAEGGEERKNGFGARSVIPRRLQEANILHSALTSLSLSRRRLLQDFASNGVGAAPNAGVRLRRDRQSRKERRQESGPGRPQPNSFVVSPALLLPQVRQLL